MASVVQAPMPHSLSEDDRLFHIICSKAGITPSDLSEDHKRSLISDEQTRGLWQQLRQRAIGHGGTNNNNDISAKTSSLGQGSSQLAEFERVNGVEGVHDQLSLTPERIAQTEAELENLNRKTQSLVDTLRSHNTRLNAIRDGTGTSAAAGGAKAALSSKIVELRARKQALADECEQLSSHADQRLDRYVTPSQEPNRHDGKSHTSNGISHEPSASTRALRETFDSLLDPHDRILEKLDVLCTELRFDDSEQKAVLQDARRLSNEIIFAIVAHQRMVLDIVFIQACKSYQDKTTRGGKSQSRAKAADDEREAIVADLRSLWDEVVPVAHMAVEKQLVGPIMKSKSNESDMRDSRYALIASYTSAMLGYMNERLEEFANRITTLVAHHKALVKTFEVFQARTTTTTKNDKRGAESAQPRPPNQASKTKKPGRTNTATTSPTRNTDKPLEDVLSAIEALGVTLPPMISSQAHPSGSGGESKTFVMAQHLDAQIQRRSAKSHVLATDMQALFEATAKTSLTEALEATRMLADSLVAECNGGLLPAEVEEEGEGQGSNDGVRAGGMVAAGEEGGGGAAGLFFADAELQKITADETASVRRVAEEFAALLRDVDPSSSAGSGDAALVPYDFVVDTYTSAVATGAGGARRGQQLQDQRGTSRRQQLRDPKIHEIIERWGGRGDSGIGH